MKKITGIITIIFFMGFCASSIESSLDPESKLFLSQVQYIITKKEKKEFLSLKTPEQRKKFIKEFWNVRDPDPSTPENEFKIYYMARIKLADRLFREGSTPGWETDRGMVFILLGPPSDRYVQSMAETSEYKAYEIWTYQEKGFRVIFIDRRGTGRYEIDYRSATAAFYDALNQARKALRNMKQLILFRFSVKPVFKGDSLLLHVSIPANMLFYKKEKGKFFAEFRVKISGKAGEKEVNIEKDFNLPINKKGKIEVEIPVPFCTGKYSLKLSVKDMIGGETSVKKLKFNIKRRK